MGSESQGVPENLTGKVLEGIKLGINRLRGKNLPDHSVPLAEAKPTTPRTMEDVLQSIPEGVPGIFKEQARQASEFIEILDGDQEITDPRIKTFQDQLTHSGFVGHIYLMDKMRGWHPDAPSPETALPTWLQRASRRTQEEAEEEWKKNEVAFQKWVNEKNFPLEKRGGQTYYILDETPPIAQTPRMFKCYVEENLDSYLDQRRLDPLFDELKRLGLNPNQMKLFDEDRLVLYYYKDVNLADGIGEVFNRHGIKFRGPAQDVERVKPDKEGNLVLDDVVSNDQSLGEGHSYIDYKLREYNPVEFLDNYLQLCLFGGKDPTQPYKVSFVYLEDREETIPEDKRESAMAEASQLAGYPVMYTRHRLDVARR